MKVKVTYGLDMTSVPNLVESMVNNATSIMESQLGKLKSLQCMVLDSELVEHTPDIIDNIRKQISNIELELADAQSIVGGYVDVMGTPAAPPAPPLVESTTSQEEAPSYEKTIRPPATQDE